MIRRLFNYVWWRYVWRLEEPVDRVRLAWRLARPVLTTGRPEWPQMVPKCAQCEMYKTVARTNRMAAEGRLTEARTASRERDTYRNQLRVALEERDRWHGLAEDRMAVIRELMVADR